jgi:hypothetical protein
MERLPAVEALREYPPRKAAQHFTVGSAQRGVA